MSEKPIISLDWTNVNIPTRYTWWTLMTRSPNFRVFQSAVGIRSEKMTAMTCRGCNPPRVQQDRVELVHFACVSYSLSGDYSWLPFLAEALKRGVQEASMKHSARVLTCEKYEDTDPSSVYWTGLLDRWTGPAAG